jgi:hypothetical protein
MKTRSVFRNNTAPHKRARFKWCFTKREVCAHFILNEADKADLRIGTNGNGGLILVPPLGMAAESFVGFRDVILAFADEISTIILREASE